jgi:hypothetical protein
MTFFRTITGLGLLVSITGHAAANEDTPNSDDGIARNLLMNADFELTGKNDVPVRWIVKQHAGQRAYEVRADRVGPHHGEYSLRIHRFREQVWGLAEQIVPAFHLVGKTVRLRLWVRTDAVDNHGATVYLGAYNGSLMLQESRHSPITGSIDWTRYELELEVPSETTQLQAGLTLHGAGTVWIDSAELVEVDANPDDSETAK